MVGADIISEQYNSIMRIFVIQTVVSIFAGLVVFTLATHWFSGKVNLIVNKQRYTAHQAEQKLALENTALERVNSKGGGAGIGLAICKHIMEAHGGTIAIASDNGTLVPLTLPEYSEGG